MGCCAGAPEELSEAPRSRPTLLGGAQRSSASKVRAESETEEDTTQQLGPAELSPYFAGGYLRGELFQGERYASDYFGELRSFRFDADDGPVHVWQHAVDLRDASCDGDVCVLYRYTDAATFGKVAQLEQSAGELLASLPDDGAVFGGGLCMSQREPSVWKLRRRILLNSYSSSSPLREPEDDEAVSILARRGDGGPEGHCGAFCIPFLVPRAMAHDASGQSAPEHRKKLAWQAAEALQAAGHPGRDLWVVRAPVGQVLPASAEADGLLRLLRLRLEKLRSSPGGDDFASLGCMAELAARLQGWRHLDEAEELYEELVARCLQRLALGGAGALAGGRCLAESLRAQGRPREAEEVLRGVLEGGVELPEGHRDILRSFGELTALLHEQGRLSEAAALGREALRRHRSALGSGHVETLRSCQNLAAILEARGQLQEAEALLREALEGRRHALGVEHPESLQSLNALAVLLEARGRPQEAEPLSREAVARRRAELGQHHPDTLSSLNNLATVLQARERLDEAELLYREALAKRRARLPAGHPDTATSRHNLAHLLQAQGRLEEAEPLCREALAQRRATLRAGHPDTLMSLSNLAALLEEQGRLQEAEPLGREALRLRRAHLVDGHPDTMTSLNNLASLLQKRGSVEEAEGLYREALGLCQAHLDSAHPDTLNSIFNLATLLEETGRSDEAELLFRRELELCSTARGDEDPETERSVANLARFLQERGKTPELLQLLQELGIGFEIEHIAE